METDALMMAQKMGVTPTAEAVRFLGFALAQVPPGQPIWLDRKEIPVEHIFTPGLYMRTAELAGPAILMTRAHLTKHPFTVIAGECFVWDSVRDEVQALVAPMRGITEPGTVRLIFVPEHVAWTTVHATDETDPERIVETMTASPIFAALPA